jgi:hypothetical protein
MLQRSAATPGPASHAAHAYLLLRSDYYAWKELIVHNVWTDAYQFALGLHVH